MQERGMKSVPAAIEDIIGRYASSDIVDPSTGEIIVECNDEITVDRFNEIKERGVRSFKALYIDNLHITSSFRDTLLIDKVSSSDEGLIEIYRRLRPGDPPTLKSSLALFDNLFFNPERYDLSAVGRLKLNYKLGLKVWQDCMVLNAPCMLSSEDVSSFEALIARIAHSNDPFAKYLMMKLPSDLAKTLKKVEASQPISDKLGEQLLHELNNIIRDNDFFQKELFATFGLSKATIKLSEM